MSSSNYIPSQPSALLTRLLNWSLPSELREPVIGDLWEEYEKRSQVSGSIAAKIWFSRQAIKTSLQFVFKTKKGVLMFILSMLFFAFIILIGMYMSGDAVLLFVNAPSFILTVPTALFFAVVVTSLKYAKLSLVYTLEVPQEAKQVDVIMAAKFLNTFGNGALFMGFLSMLIGWIAIGWNLDDVSAFGPAFAVSILTVFYALIVKIICFVAEQKIQNQYWIMQQANE